MPKRCFLSASTAAIFSHSSFFFARNASIASSFFRISLMCFSASICSCCLRYFSDVSGSIFLTFFLCSSDSVASGHGLN